MEQRRKNPKKTILTVMIVLCVAMMAVCAVMIVLPLLEYRAGDQLYADLAQPAAEQPTVAPQAGQAGEESAQSIQEYTFAPDFAALAQVNDDIAAWLICEGTVIHYPVVQGTNNSYYLTHLFDKTRNRMGTLFIDCGNTPGFADENTVIYGHHMKSGSMFAALVGYKEQSYFDAYPAMRLLAPGGNFRVELFSGYVTGAASEAYRKTFATEEDFAQYLLDVREKSDFESDIQVTAQDRIVTLSTCTYEFNNARYVVHGKLVPLTDR